MCPVIDFTRHAQSRLHFVMPQCSSIAITIVYQEVSQSLIDSKFLTLGLSLLGFLGDSAFHKKLSPQQIPVSVDLEDSIVGMTAVLSGDRSSKHVVQRKFQKTALFYMWY